MTHHILAELGHLRVIDLHRHFAVCDHIKLVAVLALFDDNFVLYKVLR